MENKAREILYSITEETVRAALARAVVKAGVTSLVAVSRYCDRTDPYADLSGFEVTGEDAETVERAVVWLFSYLAARSEAFYKVNGGSPSIDVRGEGTFRVYRHGNRVQYMRWYIGE